MFHADALLSKKYMTASAMRHTENFRNNQDGGAQYEIMKMA